MKQNIKEVIETHFQDYSGLFDTSTNIEYLRATIAPLLRGAIKIHDKMSKFVDHFSACMRFILTSEQMAKDGKLRQASLFSFMMDIWRTTKYDETMLLIQNEMIQTEAAFDKLLPPLETVSSSSHSSEKSY